MKLPELIEGVHYYINDAGYVVLTSLYHLEKGYCCGLGCLHCPYDHENVPETKPLKINPSPESDLEDPGT